MQISFRVLAVLGLASLAAAKPTKPAHNTCCCCVGESMSPATQAATCLGDWRRTCKFAEATGAFDRDICAVIRCAM